MGSPLAAFGDPEIIRVNREAITANKTLTDTDKPVQILGLDQARNVTLPAERLGRMFYISNVSAGASSITLKNDAADTLGTIAQYQAALAISDGTGWLVILGAAMTAQT